MLKVVGLGAEAEMVCERLLDSGPVTETGLATLTTLAGPQVRAALRALESRGLAHRTQDRPARYCAANPSIALDVLLLQREEEEEEVKRARIRARDLAERFGQATASQDPDHLLEVVTGRDAVTRRLDTARGTTRHEVRNVDKPPYVFQPGPSTHGWANPLHRRGGKRRSLYERASIELPGRLNSEVATQVGPGEHRVVEHLPTKMILIDDRLAVVPLQIAPTILDGIVVVYRSALLEALSALFEALWAVALPLALATSAPGTTDLPTPQDRTRFQLAHQAARRGWLSDERG